MSTRESDAMSDLTLDRRGDVSSKKRQCSVCVAASDKRIIIKTKIASKHDVCTLKTTLSDANELFYLRVSDFVKKEHA